MPSRAHRPRHAFLIATSLLMLAAPTLAAAQSITVHAGSADSTWIVERVRPVDARASLATQDRQVAVVLLDTTLVLQFTDAGLSRFRQTMRDSTPPGVGQHILAEMFGAALGTMFDHGIACPLSSVRQARVDDGRLVFEGRDGRRVFENVEVNGRDVMRDFSPVEAARFATQVNRAIGR